MQYMYNSVHVLKPYPAIQPIVPIQVGKCAYYSSIILTKIESLLCLKLCWHNLPGPSGGPACSCDAIHGQWQYFKKERGRLLQLPPDDADCSVVAMLCHKQQISAAWQWLPETFSHRVSIEIYFRSQIQKDSCLEFAYKFLRGWSTQQKIELYTDTLLPETACEQYYMQLVVFTEVNPVAILEWMYSKLLCCVAQEQSGSRSRSWLVCTS